MFHQKHECTAPEKLVHWRTTIQEKISQCQTCKF